MNNLSKNEQKVEFILNNGLFYYKVGNENHISFFKNEQGQLLKKMWDKLNEPIPNGENQK